MVAFLFFFFYSSFGNLVCGLLQLRLVADPTRKWKYKLCTFYSEVIWFSSCYVDFWKSKHNLHLLRLLWGNIRGIETKETKVGSFVTCRTRDRSLRDLREWKILINLWKNTGEHSPSYNRPNRRESCVRKWKRNCNELNSTREFTRLSLLKVTSRCYSPISIASVSLLSLSLPLSLLVDVCLELRFGIAVRMKVGKSFWEIVVFTLVLWRNWESRRNF